MISARQKKNIEIIGLPGNVIQTKAAGDILGKLIKGNISQGSKNAFPETAVVLSDESLLIPMLQSLPHNIEHINITMGYPLKCAPLHSFWNSLFQLQENCRRSQGSISYYHKNILRVLCHPFLAFSAELSNLIFVISNEIKSKNMIFISIAEIEEITSQTDSTSSLKFLEPFLSDWKNDPLTAIDKLFSLIASKPEEKNVEAEFLNHFHNIFDQIGSLIKQHGIITDLRSLRMLYNQIVGSLTVPFSGEPLKGLQIMGILETRTLDFNNIILLSANEDVLPSGKKQNSFIPLDVKKQFGLPAYSERDAIYAYHFYRLLQKADNIFLLYNNDVSKSFGTGSGEKSRFLTQLIEELGARNPNVCISKKIHSFPSIKKKNIHVVIEKNDSIIERLDEISARGFSPTAISTFNTCPLDFYFKYIIGLREQKEVEDTVEAATLGDFIHEALFEIFEPFKGKVISPEDIAGRSGLVESTIKSAFLKKFSEHDISAGYNLLNLKVVEKIIRSFLKKEIEYVRELNCRNEKLYILDLEKEMEAELNCGGRKIKFRGKADRIDKAGKITRIIDYKTGQVSSSELKIENIEIISSEKKKSKAMQLLIYSMLFAEKNKDVLGLLTPGIISLKKLSEGFMPLAVHGSELVSSDSINIFKDELGRIISEMFNTDIPFEHSQDAEYCEHCML